MRIHSIPDPAEPFGKIFCAVHAKMGDVKESRQLLRRIMKELVRGSARRAVPSWSITREIGLMLLRPRDPDIRETTTPVATEAELNNRLLRTTSSKDVGHCERNSRETVSQH